MKYLGKITDPKDIVTLEYLEEYITNKLQGMGTFSLDAVYPVGSIYMSVNSANPKDTLGGTWVAWGSGKVPVGVNASETEFATVEKTGGEKTHTLDTTEMPSHYHTADGTLKATSAGAHTHKLDLQSTSGTESWTTAYVAYCKTGGSVYNNDNAVNSAGAHAHDITGNTSKAGGDGAHNNLQPYITCYMWKRTA